MLRSVFSGSHNETSFSQFGGDATIPQRQQSSFSPDPAPWTHLRPGHRRPDRGSHRHLFLTHSSCSSFHTGMSFSLSLTTRLIVSLFHELSVPYNIHKTYPLSLEFG